MNEWTEAELQILKLNYKQLGYRDLGEILGRSSGAVKNKCYELKLRKQVEDWTESDVTKLVQAYSGGQSPNLTELEVIFGRNRANISRKAREFGLTDHNRVKSEPHKEKMAIITKERIARNGHPKGFAGYKHTEEAKQAISEKSKANWADPNSKSNSEESRQLRSDIGVRNRHRLMNSSNPYSRTKSGKRADLDGLFLRSSWEANYARYLNWLISINQIKKWEFEPDGFEFTAIKRGTRFYIPDFKITNMDDSIEYHEVKGWMDKKSQTKLSRMAKYYPDIILIVIGAKEYRAIAKEVKRFIPHWE